MHDLWNELFALVSQCEKERWRLSNLRQQETFDVSKGQRKGSERVNGRGWRDTLRALSRVEDLVAMQM